MKQKTEIKLFKKIIFGIVIALIVGLIIYLIPIILDLSTAEGQIAFKQKVQEYGIWGMLLILGLIVAHIFFIVIPGEPIEILAGMCYGGIYGTIFMMISYGIVSTVIYLLVRKFGKKFVYEFFPQEKVDKLENSKAFKNPKIIEDIMFILFLIPGVPKDILVYIGGLLPIKSLNFIMISLIGRFPSVISSTMAGDSIVDGNWKISIIIYAITFVIVGAMILIMNKFNKNRIPKDVIDTIKE